MQHSDWFRVHCMTALASKFWSDIAEQHQAFACRYSLTWEDQGKVPSLGSYYLNTIDALYAVCPGCLFLIEGGGQSTYCGVNW